MKKFVLLSKFPFFLLLIVFSKMFETIIIGTNPIKKPPVGPRNTPKPLWKELNTGIPIMPNKQYINSINNDFFKSRTSISIKITKVCSVNGITKGIVNHELITSKVVKKAIKLMLYVNFDFIALSIYLYLLY